MSLIKIQNLTFAYDGSGESIFENVSFSIDTAWRLGFTGRNGRGKTTFLKLLCGEYEYSGTIVASESFEYFPYEISDPDDFTIDCIKSACGEIEDWKIHREINLLDADEEILYRPFKTLSKGEQTKAMLAGMFLRENSFLLIDEPTNHLDAYGRKSLSRYLRRKSGFILVSHDRTFLDDCIDHILAINKADIEVQKGNFSSWLANKEMQDSFEQSQNEKLKSDISRLNEAAQRAGGWSDKTEKGKIGQRNSGLRPDRGFIGHKAAKMMKRSKAIEQRMENQIAEKSKLLKNIEISDSLAVSPLDFAGTMAELRDISVKYGENEVCSGVSFSVKQGDRIALSGKNGCGKSSILKILCSLLDPADGYAKISPRLKISYVPQSADLPALTAGEYADEKGTDKSKMMTILIKMGFKRSDFETPVNALSMGQKKKLLLACSLADSANLYIWDEPLNFIDVISRIQIEELILKYKPTMVFVEHDLKFTENIATEIIEI